jgi:ABC-type glycerol-3-phosphate transport system permease component
MNGTNMKTVYGELNPHKFKSKLHKRSHGQNAVFTVAFIIFTVQCASLIFCLAWGFMSSLKTQKEFSLNSPLALPENWLFSNYVTAFNSLEVRGFNLFGLIGNSIWYAVGTPLIQTTIAMIISYIAIKYPCWITKFHHGYILISMMITVNGGAAPMYRFLASLGLVNSPLFLLAKFGHTAFTYLVFCGCWKGISSAYIEAAEIDGASKWRIMFKIMIPQALGTWGALFIMDFITLWNDCTASMVYFPDWPTLATGLFEYEQDMIRNVNMPIYFAGLMIAMVPVLILFMIFQDTIMEKVNLGGVKG